MITAKQARELAGPTKEEKLEDALTEIEDAARRKERKVSLTSDMWVHGAYRNDEDYEWAKKELEKLGFTVEFFYEERQFVDMYTVVKW